MNRFLTVVTATIAPDREAELVSGFDELISSGLPEGLLRTELLRGQDGTWRIESLWRDRESLLALRRTGARHAAAELFERVGASQSHELFEVEASRQR